MLDRPERVLGWPSVGRVGHHLRPARSSPHPRQVQKNGRRPLPPGKQLMMDRGCAPEDPPPHCGGNAIHGEHAPPQLHCSAARWQTTPAREQEGRSRMMETWRLTQRGSGFARPVAWGRKTTAAVCLKGATPCPKTRSPRTKTYQQKKNNVLVSCRATCMWQGWQQEQQSANRSAH